MLLKYDSVQLHPWKWHSAVAVCVYHLHVCQLFCPADLAEHASEQFVCYSNCAAQVPNELLYQIMLI